MFEDRSTDYCVLVITALNSERGCSRTLLLLVPVVQERQIYPVRFCIADRSCFSRANAFGTNSRSITILANYIVKHIQIAGTCTVKFAYFLKKINITFFCLLQIWLDDPYTRNKIRTICWWSQYSATTIHSV